MTLPTLVRISFTALLIMAGWKVYHQQSAWNVFEAVPGIEGAREAIVKDPAAPEFHYRLGLLTGSSIHYYDLETAARHLRTTVKLNPFDWRCWIQLARASEAQGDLEEAERAYSTAVRLNPRSASYHWHLANFQFRKGSIEEAVRHVDAAIDLDPAYRVSWLVLLKRTGDWQGYVQQRWPTDRSSRLVLLNFLTREERANPGKFAEVLSEQWASFISSESPPSFQEAGPYLAYLLESGNYQKLRSVWLLLAKRHDLIDEAFRLKKNYVWNGGFDLPFQGMALDWRVVSRAGYTVERASEEGIPGTERLRLTFDGSRNLDFRGVSQVLLIEPDMHYRLSFQARSESLSTDEGLSVQITDRTSGDVLAQSEPITGTTPWTTFEVFFAVPEVSESLELQLRRQPSRRIANQFHGVFWLDNVRLETWPVGS
jgi:tetratricopeptide (TPR) repeat protein